MWVFLYSPLAISFPLWQNVVRINCYLTCENVILLICLIFTKGVICLITDFNAFKAMREKRDNSLYAEINTHEDHGYMSTSIWSYEEVKDMISHTARKPRAFVDETIERIINGEEVSFKVKNGITSTFRLATEDDISNAEKDEIEYNNELDDFIHSPHDKSLEDMLLNYLGLDDKK